MKTKYVILCLAFFIVSVTSFFGLRRYFDYRKFQQEQEFLRQEKVWHDKFLNRIFSSIQSDRGRVTFYLREGVVAFYISPHDGRLTDWVSGSRSFSPGETFQDLNHHAKKLYTIVRVESDGVVVGYGGYGQKRPTGTVRLPWR
jgi:hypothetical protein